MSPTAAGTTADIHSINARLERLPHCSWHNNMRAIVGTAWFFDAFDSIAIGFVLTVLIGQWNLTPGRIGILISIAFAGQLVGSILAGWVAERWGRRPAMVGFLLVFTLMAFAAAIAPNYQALLLIRFIQGLGLGGETPVMHAYINEFATAQRRGRFSLGAFIPFSFGMVACSLASLWVIPNLGWRWMFIVGALPAVLVIPLRRLLPESPRWLASKGRFEEADRSLKRIEDIAVKEGKAFPPLLQDLPPAQEAKTRLGDLFKGIYRRRTTTLWILWFCSNFVTYGILTWAPSLYKTVFNLPVDQALGYAFALSAVGLVGSIVCVFAIDYTGRKPLFAGAMFLTSLPLLWFLVGGDRTVITVLLVLCISYFGAAIPALGLGMYTAESYPNHMRALGTGIGLAWARLASIISPLLVGAILPVWGVNAVFVVFGVAALIGAIVCAVFAIETRGKVLEVLSPAP